MTTPEDLDELLSVNPVKTWLLFSAIGIVLAGFLLWGFLGTITQEVKGDGIIKVGELPRPLVAGCSGQVDSVLCRTGDRVVAGQVLIKVKLPVIGTHQTVNAPFDGTITSVNVKEGGYVETGTEVLQLMKSEDGSPKEAEVIFFVSEPEVSKLKKGMVTNLQVNREGVAPDLLKAEIIFISEYPVESAAIRKYLPEAVISMKNNLFYEIRASLPRVATTSSADKKVAGSLNGLSCRVAVTVSRNSPVSYLMH